MYLHSPLKMLVGGCSLITSCSIWIFEGQNPVPTPLISDVETQDISPSVQAPQSIPVTPPAPTGPIYLDECQAVDKLVNWNGKSLSDPNFKVESSITNNSVTISFVNEPTREQVRLSMVNSEVESFKPYTNNTKDQYKQFDKNSIKISLFKNPAWYSSTKNDEYKPIEDKKVLELFDGTDEVKVKQLLLSLSHRVDWKKQTDTSFYPDITYVSSIDELKDLKIKYFKEFEKLKNYVLVKVKTCTTDDRACIPTKWEFDYMETDTNKYFQDIWSGSET